MSIEMCKPSYFSYRDGLFFVEGTGRALGVKGLDVVLEVHANLMVVQKVACNSLNPLLLSAKCMCTHRYNLFWVRSYSQVVQHIDDHKKEPLVLLLCFGVFSCWIFLK